MIRSLGPICLLLALSACAIPAKPENMTVTAPTLERWQDPGLANAVYLDEVRGGEPTDPLWTSEVGNEEFRQALADSLRKRGYLSETPEGSAYLLRANLLGVSQPIFGFEFEVTTHVNYELIVKESDAPYMLETISAAYTADMGDAFFGVQRLRLANEGAIRANIEAFLEKLATQASGV